MKFNIKRAEIKDVPSLLVLWKEMMSCHQRLSKKDFQLKKNSKKVMKKFFIKNIKSKNSIVLMAIVNKKIIGYLMVFIDKLPPVYKNEKYAYISDGIVTKKYRKKGVMKKMVNEASKFFKKKGLKEIGLKVYSKNMSGIQAWYNIGFKEDAKLMFMNIK